MKTSWWVVFCVENNPCESPQWEHGTLSHNSAPWKVQVHLISPNCYLNEEECEERTENEKPTCVGSAWPLIFPDIYFHSWAQWWPPPPVLDTQDKCQYRPPEACCARMLIGNQVHPCITRWGLRTPLSEVHGLFWHPAHHCVGNGRKVCCIFTGMTPSENTHKNKND